MNSPILSICIPTLNRCDYLKKSVDSIVSQNEFDYRVEIIVSDNNSSDGTEDLMRDYSSKYSNIVYSRNDENIGFEKNFRSALRLASGDYLRVVNDYVLFQAGSLAFLLTLVEDNSDVKPVMFFNQHWRPKTDSYYEVIGMENMLKETSFYITWITGFGIWRSDLENCFDKIGDNVVSEFIQIHLLIEQTRIKSTVIIVNKIHVDSQKVRGKGGYSFFKVFVELYLKKMIYQLYKKKQISYTTLFIERHRLLRHHLYVFYKKLVIEKNKGYTFDKSGVHTIVFKEFWNHPTFYLVLFKIGTYNIKFAFRSLFKR